MPNINSRTNSTVDLGLTSFVQARGVQLTNLISPNFITRPKKSHGFIWKSRNNHLRLADTVRAAGIPVSRITNDYDKDAYKCILHGLGEDIDKDTLKEADDALNLEESIVSDLQDALYINREKDFVDVLFDSSFYVAQSMYLLLSSGNRWSQSASTPIANLNTAFDAVQDQIGLPANFVAINGVGFNLLGDNGDILQRLSNLDIKSLTPEALSKMLNNKGQNQMKQIMIGMESYNSSVEKVSETADSNQSYTKIIPNQVVVGRLELNYNVDNKKSNNAIVIIQPEGEDGDMVVEKWYDKETRSWHYENNYYRDIKRVQLKGAFMIDNIY